MENLKILDNSVTCRRDADFSVHETHYCFECLKSFGADPNLRCPTCMWLQCPACGACACRLSDSQKLAMEQMFHWFCLNHDPKVRRLLIAMLHTFEECERAAALEVC